MFWKKKPTIDYRNDLIAFEEMLNVFFSQLDTGIAKGSLSIFNQTLDKPDGGYTDFEKMCYVYREIFLQYSKAQKFPMKVKTGLYKMSNDCTDIYRGKVKDRVFHDHLNAGGLAAGALFAASVEAEDFYNNPADTSNKQLRDLAYQAALKLHQSKGINKELLLGSNSNYWK